MPRAHLAQQSRLAARCWRSAGVAHQNNGVQVPHVHTQFQGGRSSHPQQMPPEQAVLDLATQFGAVTGAVGPDQRHKCRRLLGESVSGVEQDELGHSACFSERDVAESVPDHFHEECRGLGVGTAVPVASANGGFQNTKSLTSWGDLSCWITATGVLVSRVACSLELARVVEQQANWGLAP